LLKVDSNIFDDYPIFNSFLHLGNSLSRKKKSWSTNILNSLVFSDPNGEYPPQMRLSMMAGVVVERITGDYACLASGGWIFNKHIRAINKTQPDFMATASMFNREPYLWGGRGGQGIDCSGIVQISLAAAGIIVARDTDQQANSIGIDVPFFENTLEIEKNSFRCKPARI
jgi:cell wall-associated NlpC family hydrolase